KSIAVIGMSGRFPGADNLQDFWKILSEGKSVFTQLSDEQLQQEGIAQDIINQPNYKKVSSLLNNIDKFDAAFFDIPAREALVLDPQHRLFLEGCWESLEMAGYSGVNTSRSIGVFAGASMNSYWMHNLACQPQYVTTTQGFQGLLGNEKDYLATRVAYKMNLHGPAVTVQTACSTSLVAIHMACQNLLLGECDLALAGGVSIKVPHQAGYLYQEGLPFSADGSCRTFDKEGSGTVFGSGMGVVLLKPFNEAVEDGDPILAVIRGSFFNNDGNRKIGFTAPSGPGQEGALKNALLMAEVDPASVTYIEAHGTGTNLGDPIEISAIQNAYDVGQAEPCAIGSVKANVGHLETAAGITGFIKTILMLQHKKLVPAANFSELNPHIDLNQSRIYVNTKLQDWKPEAGVCRASVSSFGMGGTNVHLVVEEAPLQKREPAPVHSRNYILPLSAKTQTALDGMTNQLADWLARNPNANIDDLAFSLQQRKSVFPFKRTLLANTCQDAANTLNQHPEKVLSMNSGALDQVVFLYAGAGAQYANMGRGLYDSEAVYREALDFCAEFLEPMLGVDIRNFIFVDAQKIDAGMKELQVTDIMFPASFCVQYALTQLFRSWGIEPIASMGHSHGEYMVAWLNGVMSIETALTLVAKRAILMLKLQPGAMAVVPASLSAVNLALKDFPICIAAVNSEKNTVISGSLDDLETAKKLLHERLQVDVKNLHINAGLHSKLTDIIYEEFLAEVKRHPLSPPKNAWLSSTCGDWVKPEQVCDPVYWANHMRKTVHFKESCQKIYEKFPKAAFIDMGPSKVVGELLRENNNTKSLFVFSPFRNFRQEISDDECVLQELAKLWLLGYPLQWEKIYPTNNARYLSTLPTYPFDRQRYWVEPPKGIGSVPVIVESEGTDEGNEGASESGIAMRPNLMTPYADAVTDTQKQIKKIWQDFFGIEGIGIYDNFIELGGTSLLATEVNSSVKAALKVDLTLAQFLEAGNIQELANKVEELQKMIEEKIMLELLKEFETDVAG
ncbi:MAG: polyketide synthase family protein, partial [Cellvibrio sp.]|nr:polyketide synthase family protein [Cellvibrio sp.]